MPRPKLPSLRKLSQMSALELSRVAGTLPPIPWEEGVTPASLADANIDLSVREQEREEKARLKKRRLPGKNTWQLRSSDHYQRWKAD